MKKINLIMVDDSVVIRKLVGDYLAKDPEINLIATAVNGKIGLEKINQLHPDIVILDIEMPEMNGLETLIKLREEHPKLPVIMFSSLTKEGAEATLTALSNGANDYVTKEVYGYTIKENLASVGEELLFKIKGLVKRPSEALAQIKKKPVTVKLARSTQHEPIHIVAIGTSTGGPNALKSVLPDIVSDFPVPIVIVQHMPAVFTKILAESLTKDCKIPIVEAQEGDILMPGKALIAPGNYHMTIVRQGKNHVVRLNQDPPENYCRPAVDVLFRSVASNFGANILAVIMTGMGHDGLDGCRLIKDGNGQILAQDEASSVVWGMPGAVATAGLADEILPLKDIAQAINQRVNRRRDYGQ